MFVDCEMAFDMDYAIKLGLDTSEDRFVLIQPESANQAVDMASKAIQAGLFSAVAIDSIPALTPEQNINAEVGDHNVATLARFLSTELKRLMTAAKVSNTALICINQWRSNIGFTGGDKAMPGGQAMKYYPSVTIDLKRVDIIKKGENVIGQTVRANFLKNRFGSPYAKVDFNLYYGIGIKKDDELIEVAVEKKIIKQGGAWYTITLKDGSLERAQGKNGVASFYEEHPEEFSHLRTLVLSTFNNKVKEVEETEELDEDIIE